jgi:hypothetical protein
MLGTATNFLSSERTKPGGQASSQGYSSGILFFLIGLSTIDGVLLMSIQVGVAANFSWKFQNKRN